MTPGAEVFVRRFPASFSFVVSGRNRMHVRQVLGSGARRETYTLVDDDGRVIELVDDYLALCTDREHSPNTLRARAYDLKEWLTFLRLLDIAPLAAVPEHVDQFAGWLRRPVGPGQLERRRPARPGDHAGFLAGIAERSVGERPTRLKEKKRRPETLSDAEVQQILDACDRLRDRLLMSVMFETGCRIGQALGMRHEDINTDRLTIT